jgi:hypothetical protein
MQGFSQAIRHLALIAMVMRAMLAAGWMPDAQAGLTLCSVSATLGVIHHDGGPASPDDPSNHQANHQASHQECPFAAAPQLASTPDAPQLALPAFHAFAAAIDRAYAATVAARFTPHAPRGPPTLA